MIKLLTQILYKQLAEKIKKVIHLTMRKKEPLEVIIGEQLSSVVFVQDYLQLDFDGNKLTCYIWPKVNIGEEYEFSNLNYRNILCGLIAKIVSTIKVDEGETVYIYFEGNSSLKFNLNEVAPQIGNAIILDTYDGEWSTY